MTTEQRQQATELLALARRQPGCYRVWLDAASNEWLLTWVVIPFRDFSLKRLGTFKQAKRMLRDDN